VDTDEAPGGAAADQRLLRTVAILLYRVGDAVTTVRGLSTGGVAEAGHIAVPVIESYGRYGLVVLKLVIVTAFYLLWTRLRGTGPVAVPLALATTGGVVSAWNLTTILVADRRRPAGTAAGYSRRPTAEYASPTTKAATRTAVRTTTTGESCFSFSTMNWSMIASMRPGRKSVASDAGGKRSCVGPRCTLVDVVETSSVARRCRG